MDCETQVRLEQIVRDATLALDRNDTLDSNLEKRRMLWTAELHVFEHDHTCLICHPAVEEIDA
jgi:hypothetical protein